MEVNIGELHRILLEDVEDLTRKLDRICEQYWNSNINFDYRGSVIITSALNLVLRVFDAMRIPIEDQADEFKRLFKNVDIRIVNLDED
jgi:hypothetical protein